MPESIPNGGGAEDTDLRFDKKAIDKHSEGVAHESDEWHDIIIRQSNHRELRNVCGICLGRPRAGRRCPVRAENIGNANPCG